MVISLFSTSKSSTQPTTSALDRITSSMFHSCLEHQLVTLFVLPVSDFWQFGPWWIPKLGNQPTLGLHPKFSLLSSPLDRFDSCGVRQAIYFICSDNISFCLRELGSTQSDLVGMLIGWMKFFSVRMQIQERTPSSPVAHVIRISEWRGRWPIVNQLTLGFPKPEDGELQG